MRRLATSSSLFTQGAFAPLAHATYCMFCGTAIVDAGEAYYDHLRLNKGCESAWRTWRENLLADHPGGD